MELLGKGAYAKVYQKGKVALKIQSLKKPACREKKALEKLQKSVNVINLLDSYIYKRYYILELELGKCTLNKIPFKERFQMVPRLFDFAINVLRDLWLAHCSHNDIKARNIVVMSNGDFKLIDFGVASFNGPPDWNAFTPGIKPFEGYTRYADIWCMGLTILGFVLGKNTDTRFKEALPKTKWAVDVRSMNTGLPEKYIRILQQMLLFKPQLRYKVLGL